jgi:hypothetical protein
VTHRTTEKVVGTRAYMYALRLLLQLVVYCYLCTGVHSSTS